MERGRPGGGAVSVGMEEGEQRGETFKYQWSVSPWTAGCIMAATIVSSEEVAQCWQ